MKHDRLVRLIIAFLVFVAAGILLRGYITDDTYIHLRYAQNLLDRGEFSFNPGESTYGATSPLWIFGLAAFLGVGLPPFAAAWLLGTLSGLLVLMVLDVLLERLPLPPFWRAGVLILVAVDAWFLRWTFSGMETSLATAILVVLLLPLLPKRSSVVSDNSTPGSKGSWWHYLAWGVTAGLAGLVRPEFMLLTCVAFPWLLWRGFQRGNWRNTVSRALVALGGQLLVLGPWLLFAWSIFGRITPGTAAAKSNVITLDPGILLPYLFRSIGQLAATQGILWLAWLGLLILVISQREKMRLPDKEQGYSRQSHLSVRMVVALIGTVVTWSIVLVGGYAVNQVWIISRYLAPLTPVLLVALALAGAHLQKRIPAASLRYRVTNGVLLAGLLGSVALNFWLLTARVRPHAEKFPIGLKECYLGMGYWLHDNSSDDAIIAALDIGAVGYASDRRVLDLMGLVSPDIMAMGRELGFEQMVLGGDWLVSDRADFKAPDYFIDRAEGEPRWAGKTVRGTTFELLDTCIIEGVGLREPQPWTVALYRLNRTDDQ